ncbi:nuclear distribution protein nudE-like 1-A isoform X2 [Cimex lectularius]|uniref:NUDE domain-containing protein n=1 Tax=Cimex lectularius TaxID=79782 RepID=A0A8I6RIW0_CIMLE|nr:nuclear distribution protein nudE-like 1-A isoform X2 [Cimex lectularius]
MSKPVKDAEYWKSKCDELEKELEDFQESSHMLEKELESSLEQSEKTIKELRRKTNSLQFENDSLKDKYDELKKRTEAQITELEEEAAQSHKREEEYVKYIRELEQKNDDLERAQRATYTSLGEFETKLNSALERNVLLESELDEKELLKSMVQRLKDETRDLKQEIEVRGKCNHHSNDHTRIVDTNKLDSESNSSPGHNPPLKSLNGLSTSRVSAANIVSELLRTVGVLESKLIVRANQRDFVSQNDSAGKDHMRRGKLNRGASSPSIHNLVRS